MTSASVRSVLSIGTEGEFNLPWLLCGVFAPDGCSSSPLERSLSLALVGIELGSVKCADAVLLNRGSLEGADALEEGPSMLPAGCGACARH